MKILIYITVVIAANSSLFAQEISYPEQSEKRSVFELKVANIPVQQGEIRIAIFNSEASYEEKENPEYAVVLPADSSSVTWNNSDLPYGNYAIAVYHDRNANGELDSNLLGIPKEAYGFSNNARGRFGPASWSDAHFEVSSETSNMFIEIK